MSIDRPSRGRRVGAPLALLLSLMTALTAVGVAMSPSASAHAALVSSNPADGSTVTSLPQRGEFVFNENINPSYAQMVVQDGGAPRALDPVAVQGPSVSAGLPRDLKAGPVTLSYRVVSADGHPVSGQVTFTYQPPGGAATPSRSAGDAPSTPTSSASSAATAPSSDSATSASSQGVNWLPIALLALGAVLLVGFGVWMLRSQKRQDV